MDNVFEQITKETYDVFTINCADAVQRTLFSVGFDVNEKIKVDGNYTFANGNLRMENKIKESAPMRPNTAFRVIKQNNPQGTHIRLR